MSHETPAGSLRRPQDHNHNTHVPVTCEVAQCRARAAGAQPLPTEPANSLENYPVLKVGQRVRVLTNRRCRSRDGVNCLGAATAKSIEGDK